MFFGRDAVLLTQTAGCSLGVRADKQPTCITTPFHSVMVRLGLFLLPGKFSSSLSKCLFFFFFPAEFPLSGRCPKLPCSNAFADGVVMGSVWGLSKECTAWDKIIITNYFRMKGICEISVSNISKPSVLCTSITYDSFHEVVWG